jgi:UDP-glucose 6-dehydrogenase
VINILNSPLFEKQLKDILQEFAKEDLKATQNFKMYLDTIILNMPSKAKKYKKSIYFDDENIKDIDHQGFLIVFLMPREGDENYVILGIFKKR